MYDAVFFLVQCTVNPCNKKNLNKKPFNKKRKFQGFLGLKIESFLLRENSIFIDFFVLS